MDMKNEESLFYRVIKIVLVVTTAMMIIFVLHVKCIGRPFADTSFRISTIRISQSGYTVDRDADHKTVLDTDYRYDDCLPIHIHYDMPGYNRDITHVMFAYPRSWARMWLDDELIYSYYPEKNDRKYDYPISIFHHSELPEDWKDKTLHIEIIPTSNTATDVYPDLYLGDRGSLMIEMLMYSLPGAVLCGVLVIFAFGVLVLSFTKAVKRRKDIKQQARTFSLLLFDIGLWFFLETKIRQLLFQNYILSQSLIALSYSLIPVFIGVFLNSYQYFSTRRIFRCLVLLTWLQFIAFTVGALAGIPFANMRIMVHISSAPLITYISALLVKVIINRSAPGEISALIRSAYWLLLGLSAEVTRYLLLVHLQSGVFLMTAILLFTVQYVYLTFRDMMEDSVETIRENEELIVNLEEERVRGMMIQMNPHFLYNALTAIQAVIRTDPDYAFLMIKDFSVHLRSVIKEISVDKIPFKEEMENVRAYLNLERMRFGDHLKIEYDIRCEDFEIVPLSVQPLVENSSRHGLFPKGKQGGTITVKSYEEPTCYVVQVIDDGVGFDIDKYQEEASKGIHIGIYNVKYRLNKVLDASIDFVSSPELGTIATIEIPKKNLL